MTSMSSSRSEFREDDYSVASESFWSDSKASRIYSDDDDETVYCNPSNKRRQSSDSTNVQEEEATCSAPLTTVDTNRRVKRTRQRHFKPGDTVDMDDPEAVARMKNRERQKVQGERKKTIQSRINHLTGKDPDFEFNMLRTTGIRVLRRRLQAIENPQPSQYPLLPVDGRSNISTTNEPEEEQQKGDAGMLDGEVGREYDSVWGENEIDEASAWWSQSFGGTAESWIGFQDYGTAMFQQQDSVVTYSDEFHWDLLNNEHGGWPTSRYA